MESNEQFSNIKCRSIEILFHTNKDNIVTYTIEIILSNNQSIIIKERYSDLLSLHNLMSKEAKMPNFPPKKYFGNTEEQFLNQRQTELNNYYYLITSSDKYVNLPSFRTWIKNKFSGIKIKKNEEYKYFDMDDINTEITRQKMIENEIKAKIIPLFTDLTKESKPKTSLNSHDNREIKYNHIINSELFPFVENEPYSSRIEGNNINFNYIGSKKNNFTKVEKLFNSKINDINKKINNECFDSYKISDLFLDFDI